MPSIRAALDLLNRVKDSGETGIIVSYSGGKDSIAVAQMCCDVFGAENVHPFFYWLHPDLDIEQKSIRAAERRFGFHVRQYPSPVLATIMRRGYMLPQPIGVRRQLKYADLFTLMRSVTGCRWIAQGHRMDESLQRRGMIKPTGGIDDALAKVWPLWDWNAKSSYAYVRSRKLSGLLCQTGSGDTSGISLDAGTLLWLREHHPGDFAKLIERFPFAESKILRNEQRAAAGVVPLRHRQ